MIATLIGFLAKGVGEKAAPFLAWALIGATIVGSVVGLKTCYDNSVIDNSVNEANVDFQGNMEVATGEADVGIAAAEAEHDLKTKKTEELLDEAIIKGCAVAEYLDSNGELCEDGNPVQGTDP